MVPSDLIVENVLVAFVDTSAIDPISLWLTTAFYTLRNCKKSTCIEMQLRRAIEHWNNGEVFCNLSDTTIE